MKRLRDRSIRDVTTARSDAAGSTRSPKDLMQRKGKARNTRPSQPLGAKCGNDNFESILHANTLCNQLGMDTISTGNVLAWAMECHEKGRT